MNLLNLSEPQKAKMAARRYLFQLPLFILFAPVMFAGCIEGPEITEPTINLPLEGEYTVVFKSDYRPVEWTSIGVDSTTFVDLMVREYGETRTVTARSTAEDRFVFEGELPVRPTNLENECSKEEALVVYLHEGTYELYDSNFSSRLTTFYVPDSFGGLGDASPCVVVNVRAVLNR